MTPMSYLELLGSFKRQLAAKRADVGRNRSRLQVRNGGLNILLTCVKCARALGV